MGERASPAADGAGGVVAQICNLLYRGIAFRKAPTNSRALEFPERRRFQIGDTAQRGGTATQAARPATISGDTHRVQLCATPSGRAESVSSFEDAPWENDLTQQKHETSPGRVLSSRANHSSGRESTSCLALESEVTFST
jgi:hypothetical protein